MADRVVVLRNLSDEATERDQVELLLIYEIPVGSEIKNADDTIIVTQPTDLMDGLVKRVHDEVGIFSALELAALNSGHLVFERKGLTVKAGQLGAAARAAAWRVHDKLKPPFIRQLRKRFRLIGFDIERP